jgi:hypothetical protein
LDLQSITVQVPTRREREVDAAFGRSGSRIPRHQFGAAAMRVGDPEFPFPELLEPKYSVQLNMDELADTAAETIANILHVFPRGYDHRPVLDQALERRKSYPWPAPESDGAPEGHVIDAAVVEEDEPAA